MKQCKRFADSFHNTKCQYAPKKRPQKEDILHLKRSSYIQSKYSHFLAAHWSDIRMWYNNDIIITKVTQGHNNMNIHGLQVSSSSFRDTLRLERSLQHLSTTKKEAKFDLTIACFVLVFFAVCLLSLWFSFCGRFFGAYWHFLSVETVCKLFKMFYSKWETELRY